MIQRIRAVDADAERRIPLDADAVAVTDLVKRFGRFTAVDRISFSVRTGEIFGFLGPNGAGKSTTIRMLCGIIAPTSGAGRVAGFDHLHRVRAHQAGHRLHVPEVFALPRPDAVRKHPLLPRDLQRAGRAVAGAHRVGLRRDAAYPGARPPDAGAAPRLAPAPGPGLRPAAPAAAALPGRAHLRGRPHHATAFLGLHPPAHRRGGHGLRHHPLHGRGPALRPGGDDQRRPDRGERAAGRDRGRRCCRTGRTRT